jgi:hypothetical protein
MIETAGAAAGAPDAGTQGSAAPVSSGDGVRGAVVEQAAIRDMPSIANKRF